MNHEGTKILEGEKKFEEVSGRVIGFAIEVHRTLGPGLLESAYEQCLCHELTQSGIAFQRQVPVPIVYKGLELECAYRLDLVVNRQLTRTTYLTSCWFRLLP